MLAIIAGIAGAAAAFSYSAHGLALAHWDARAHLVVARRILDSMTPGWQQIGGVWLPLPHVLNMLPVQVDAWYRTGASGIAISVASTAVAVWALSRFVITHTGSIAAAAAGALLVVANPNVLYLQSTPMTEPLLWATCLLAVLFTADWVDNGAADPPRRAGWAIVAACMTRYEAWPICATLIALAALALTRRGLSWNVALRAGARLARYPAVAIVLFLLNSRWTTGSWFIPSGFFVPENEALGRPLLALSQVVESVYALSGHVWTWPAALAAVALVMLFLTSRGRAPIVLVLSLLAAAAVPWYAYVDGHPVRVRYGIPLVVACAAVSAVGVGLLRRPWRALAAAVLALGVLITTRPLDPGAPLVVESRRDTVNREARRAVTEYLRTHWDGTPIMMSMGSLAHYMHDLSAIGLHLRNFLHEGNEWLWGSAATNGPRPYVRWVAIEQYAEGGDVLYQAAQRDPTFLDGFTKVAEGGGVALYERREGGNKKE